MNGSSGVLKGENLKVLRGRVEVLDIPSFHLGEKEILSLVGPNGSGKTSLLLTLNCLLRPQTGRILFRDQEIRSNQEILDYRRKIAMVFQEPLLFDTTVFNNVASGLKIRGLSREEIRTRVLKGLEQFSIAHLADRSARKLSGGEAQRTSLARALATAPEVVFLDEPFAALDPPTRQSIIKDLEKIFRETGIAAVLVTHDESEALRLSDRIMVINGGRIVQADFPEEIINRPVNRFVAEFVSMENIIPGTVLKNDGGVVMVSVPGGAIEAVGDLPPGKKVFCGIRPEKVAINIENDGVLKDYENAVKGKITDIIPSGPSLKVILECGFPFTAYAPRNAFPDLKFARGKIITVSFKADDVHLLLQES